jgi:hypothetical protein
MTMPVKIQPDCARFDDAIDRHAPPGSAAREHLQACARCRKLYDWLLEPPPAPPVSSELRQRIVSELAASLEPVVPQAGIGFSALQLLAIFGLCAAGFVALMGIAGFDVMSTAQLLGIGAVMAAGAVLCSRMLALQMLPGSRRRVAAPLAITLFGLAVIVCLLLLFPGREPGVPIDVSWQCSLRELAVAIPAAALFWFLVGRKAMLSAGAAGAAVGAMAGLVAVSVLQVACVHQNAVHLLLWHWSVMAVATAAGALAGRVSNALD